MDTFTPLIISSKKARKDLERIKAHAKEIIERHKEHVGRVAAYHEKLKAEKQQKIMERKESLNK